MTLSYQELDDWSDHLSAWLLDGRAGAGDRVFVSLQNVPQFAIAVLAIWKAGAIPVLGNPMYRERELRVLFADCSPKVSICHPAQLSDLRAAAGPAGLLLVTDPHALHGQEQIRALWPEAQCSEQDLIVSLRHSHRRRASHIPNSDEIALLLYTSGTTGVPKGAMLTHRNLLYTAKLGIIWFELDSHSRVLALAPLFHITGFVLHFCVSLVCEAALSLFLRFDAQVALRTIKEHQATFMIGAATAYIAMLNAYNSEEAPLRSITHAYSGGAPVPPALVENFLKKTGKRILTAYGMTETTAPTHAAPPHHVVPVDSATGAMAIGVPIPDTEAKIVDDNDQLCAIGEAGELCVRGPQIMAGYWHRPDETAKTVVDGWMHTGDVGFMDRNGWFYLVDRKKDMIIASGFKVWPREVEDVLYSHPAVREVAVIGLRDRYRGETVKAFVSLNGSGTCTEAELIAHCRTHLAAFKCPAAVTILSDLPRTTSGKIMRHALREKSED